MTTNEKITRIRQLMARDQVQAVIIPSGDPHMSEYFSEHWKTRRFVSGFTGSVGTYVITENASGLWVDGRYYVQAENRLPTAKRCCSAPLNRTARLSASICWTTWLPTVLSDSTANCSR